ncbi:hypothetical protein [Streptomyces sp. DH12]|uniref:hypothetical protein n=1 Tax=Streptomyces sp. DH12 TaxID=2857010 RepID=UPI001E28FFB2|nr:hypothetical protein [Streptomyces sp. DH12]
MTTPPHTAGPAPADPGPPHTADPAPAGPAPARPRPPSRPRPGARPGPAARAARAVAIGACLPYLALKAAWLSGSRVGIPDGSLLLERPGLAAAANTATLLMDTAVIVLALLLTQRWGARVPAWLLVPPLWAATGLLLPIVVGYPVQSLAAAAGGPALGEGASGEFLDGWVFTVVYGGFIVQALALGALAFRYARGRWGHVWRGTVWDLSAAVSGPGPRAAAVVASLLLLPAAALHLAWACGVTVGLSPDLRAAPPPGFHALEALRGLYALAAAAGVVALVLRSAPRLPVRLPLAVGWAGSAAVGCWGGWLFLASLIPGADPTDEPPLLQVLTYADEMITGTVLAGCLAVFLRRRAG